MFKRRIHLSTIEIEIDGKKLNAEPGSMIIEAADEAGIPIPRFCYHKKLSVAANCRMCLVDVEKVGKPLPACATPITAGMKVFTKSQKAREAQKAVMEFLLINHPLDCPICDQGGECELQDISLEYGKDVSRFTEGKRSVADEDLGPLVATEMTRCIQCTRCVRFGDEIAGMRELGTLGRGEHLWIGTYLKHSLSSEIAANIIDLCPVGALTSKPFRFTARAWELTQHRSVSPHDCVGSNLFVHTRRGEVMRVIPRENEEINETWISDRDRFSYLGIRSPERLLAPKIKIEGQWREVSWEEALEHTVEKLNSTLKKQDASELAALISPNATLEECYLLQKWIRALGCNNIDHRLHQTDFSDQASQPLLPIFSHLKISDIENQNTILILGSNLQHEQPLLATRIRKAVSQNSTVFCINPIDYPFTFKINKKIITSPRNILSTLANIVSAVSNIKNKPCPAWIALLLNKKKHFDVVNTIAENLTQTKNTLILLGEFIENHPQRALIHRLLNVLSELTSLKIEQLTFSANAAGAWLAGALPHRKEKGSVISNPGMTIKDMFVHPRKAYFLFGIEPEKDLAYAALALEAFYRADTVIACTSFISPTLLEKADILLPISTFTETAGTYINIEGAYQSFTGCHVPLGEARPGWKILQTLANLFKLENFDYLSTEDIQNEIKALPDPDLKFPPTQNSAPQETTPQGITRITAWPIYQIDPLVRHSEALQKTPLSETPQVHISSHFAKKLNFKNNEIIGIKQNLKKIKLPVCVNETIPDDCAYIPAGFEETAALDPVEIVILEKIQ